MIRKIVAVWVSLAMLFGFVVIIDTSIDFIPSVKGTTLYVNETGSGGAFTSIQDAINASYDGDTVFVYSGTYYENVVVNKTINLTGEDKDNAIVDGGGIGDVIYVNANWVNVTGFTLTNSGSSGVGGLHIEADYITISYNNISSNNAYGLYIDSTSNSNITNNIISSNKYYGVIIVSFSNNNKIINNMISYNEWDGVVLYGSTFSGGHVVRNNTVIFNNRTGIYLWGGTYNNIITKNHVISNIRDGIHILGSSNNILADNNISNNDYGIPIHDSSNNTIFNNTLINDGLFIRGDELSHFNTHTIPDNNTINNKPLYYYKDTYGLNFDGIPAGEIILANCSNSTIRNMQINNTDVGIEITYSTNISIIDNNASYNSYGVYLVSSSKINITNNILVNNMVGLNDEYSNNNTIINNNISNNVNGLNIGFSNTNLFSGNVIISNAWYGIVLGGGYGNEVSNNNVLKNNYGITISTSSRNNITNNSILNQNTYGIYLDFSSENNVSNNNASYNEYGIFIEYHSKNNNIFGNEITQNYNTGLNLSRYSYENNINENNVVENNNGIHISSSFDNLIYHNNFINNTNQSYDDHFFGENKWDNDYPMGGNYWSDYMGVDIYQGPNQDQPGSDGIGDTNYSISGGNSVDNYPLMGQYIPKIFENYTILNQGWNLISIPLIQMEQNLTRVLGSINSWYDAVQWFDNTDPTDLWKHHKVSKPFGNDLSHINETIGFWIHITQPGETIFLYNGTQPTSNQTIPLHPGWNMVGYPSLTSHNRTEGLNNLSFDTHFDAIWTYNAATQKWKELTESEYFEVGKGYYIHAKEECTWVVPL